ncbi:MAG: hypothetical protein RR619_01845, partial [Raoultibacter sp.]
GANAKVSISGGQIHALSPSGTYKIGSTDGRVEISGGNILTQDGIQNQNPGYEDINGVRNAYLPNSNTRVYHATITIPDSSGLFKLTESSYNLAGADRFRDNSLHLYLPLGKARGTYKSSSDAKFTQFAFTEVSAANTAAFAISMLFDISNESVILEEGATSKDLPALVYQSNPNTPTSNTLSALSGEQYVKFSGVNLRNTVRSPIQVDRKASLHMELAASTTNTVEATSKEAAGVGVASEGTLYISGTGKLKASQTGSSHYTAIGGSMLRGAGKVIVEDGEIEATGVAGIGGWGAELTIKGGTTTARGTTGGGVSARAILIQAGMIDSRATNGPGIGAESQINGSTLTITGGMVKAVGGGKGNHSWDVYSGRTCIQGGNVDLSLGPFFSAANPNWGLGGDLYPVKLKVAPNADLSGYEVLYARDKWATPEPFPYNLQGAKANAQGEAWLWIPKGVAKLKKKVVTAANYTLDATEDYNPDISSDDELADAFIAIVMEDGSSIFVPDLSEEFSIQEADGTFGQVTASTRPVLLRNGAPLSPDDKGEVSWLYTYGPNDEDICGTWEELVEEHSTNGALNAGEYGIGLLYISGEGEEGLGLLSGSFEVAKKELTPSMVADVPAQTVAQGVQAMPAVSVTDGNPSFVKASDYTVTYGANNVAGKGVGSVTVTATEASNYSGSVTKTFDVNVSTTPGSNSNKTTGVNSGSLAKTGDMLGLGIVGLFAVSVVALVGAVLAVRFKRRR